MFKIFKPQRRRNEIYPQPSSMPHRKGNCYDIIISPSQTKINTKKPLTSRLYLTAKRSDSTQIQNQTGTKIFKRFLSPPSNMNLSLTKNISNQDNIYKSHRNLKSERKKQIQFMLIDRVVKSKRKLRKDKQNYQMTYLNFIKPLQSPYIRKQPKNAQFFTQQNNQNLSLRKPQSVRSISRKNLSIQKNQIPVKKQNQTKFYKQDDNFCKIKLIIKQKTVQVCYKIKKIGGLVQFLKKYIYKEKLAYQKEQIVAFETIQANLQLDYYLTLRDEDGSWLNGTSLSLKPVFKKSQHTVDLNSFEIYQSIGCGGFSTVYLCRFKEDGKFYAMKTINKEFIIKNKKKNIVMNERNIMVQLNDHPFLAKIRFSFQSKSHLIFVMDYYEVGQLFNLVKKFRRMKQNVARFYIIEILLGLQQIHKHGIIYRDFKPENIMIDRKGHAYIADFGLAKPDIKGISDRAYSFCGSPEYMPPQMIIKQGHSFPVDFYCIGALLYELTTGLPPFYNTDPQKIYQGTLNYDIGFPSNVEMSQKLKNLLERLLCKDQRYRLGSLGGVKQILAHPWFERVNKPSYLEKQVEPPMKFDRVEQIKFNMDQMTKQNMKMIWQNQQNEENCRYLKVFHGFYYDYRMDCPNQNQTKDAQMILNLDSKSQRLSFEKKNSPSLAMTSCTKKSDDSFKINKSSTNLSKNPKPYPFKIEKKGLKKLSSKLYEPGKDRLLKSIENFL